MILRACRNSAAFNRPCSIDQIQSIVFNQSYSIITSQGFRDETTPPLLVPELARLWRARGRGTAGLHQGCSADDQTPEQRPAGRALQVGFVVAVVVLFLEFLWK